MTDIKTLYPQDSGYSGFDSYQPMIDDFGKVIIQVDDSDYQGDTRVFLKKDNKYGYLQFGWGSCSGCDALQACRNYEEAQKLYDQLKDDIRWFDSLEDVFEFFGTHDWEGDYSYHREEQQDFIKKVIDYCKEGK
jgi:hypothetical protein